MRSDSRGQSETIGVVLLTAVFVTLSLTVGVFLLSNFDESNQTTETVDVHSEINGQDVVIEHRGGDSYNPDDISVVLRGDFEQQWQLNEFEHAGGGDNTSFAPGDRWVMENVSGLLGEVDLLVVDDGNGELLHEDSYEVQTERLLLEINGQTDATTIPAGANVEYSVVRVFADGSRQPVTDAAELTSDLLTVDGSVLETDRISGEKSETVTAEFEELTTSIEVTAREVRPVFSIEEFELDEEAPVVAGNNLTFRAILNNTGLADGRQQVTVSGPNTVRNSLTLNSSEAKTTTFEVRTTVEDAGKINFTLATDNESSSVRPILKSPPYFEIEDTEIEYPEPGPVPGDIVRLTPEINNTGEIDGTQEAKLLVSGSVVDTNEITLDPAEVNTSTLTYEVVGEDVGESLDFRIETQNTSENEDISIKQDATFEVEITEIDGTIEGIGDAVAEGTSVTAGYQVTNTGDVPGEKQVEVTVRNGTDEIVDKVVNSSELDNEETLENSSEYDVAVGDAPQLTFNVSTVDGFDTQTVEVLEADEPGDAVAFIDEDGNGQFNWSAGEVPVSASELAAFDGPNDNLVIFGNVTRSSFDIQARHVTLLAGGSLEAENGAIDIMSNGGEVDLHGNLTANDAVDLQASLSIDIERTVDAGGAITIDAATNANVDGVLSSDAEVSIEAQGDVDGTGSNLESTDDLVIEGDQISLNESSIRADATLFSNGRIEITSDSSLFLQRATVRAEGNFITNTPGTVSLAAQRNMNLNESEITAGEGCVLGGLFGCSSGDISGLLSDGSTLYVDGATFNDEGENEFGYSPDDVIVVPETRDGDDVVAE